MDQIKDETSIWVNLNLAKLIFTMSLGYIELHTKAKWISIEFISVSRLYEVYYSHVVLRNSALRAQTFVEQPTCKHLQDEELHV